jgi:hypothetical protein
MRHGGVLSAGRALGASALIVVCALAAGGGRAAVLARPGGVSTATQTGPRLLLGRSRLIAGTRRDGAGRAQAFRFVDPVSGAVRSIRVYVAAGSDSSTLDAGLYSNRSGRPSSLLASSSVPVRGRGRWTTVRIRRTRVVAGRAYWIAMLGTGGALEIRSQRSSGCHSATDRASGLSVLPRSWSPGATGASCVSAFVSGSPSSTGVPVSAPTTPPSTPPSSPPGTPSTPAPANLSAPTISGTAAMGDTLSAQTGAWSGSPTGFTYQWQDCASATNCTNIAGASGSSYVVQASDMSDTIDVVVTASNPAGATTAASAATQAVPSTGQSVAFWLAWSGTIQESQIPWNAVTQVDLFSLTSTTRTSGCSSDCTTLNTSENGLSRMNVPGWVSAIHQQGKQAMISIGGSTDQDWANACAASNLPGFATELVDYMVSNGFDGIDIDIESLSGAGSQLTLWANCVQTLAQVAHQATTAAGRTPIVSTDVDQSWMDSAVSRFSQWPDQFNLMYYGYPTGTYSCASACSTVNSLVQGLHTTGHVPYDEMVLGMSPGGNQAQCCYNNLATTAAPVDTGGTVSSIPLSSGLSAALPAGNVVLATGENPPAHYEIFTTSGAAQGATSIPITGSVSGSGAYDFAVGSELQSDYAGPWDCGNFARYAASTGLEGVMIWDLQEEAAEHNGQFPCFAQVAPYVAASP